MSNGSTNNNSNSSILSLFGFFGPTGSSTKHARKLPLSSGSGTSFCTNVQHSSGDKLSQSHGHYRSVDCTVSANMSLLGSIKVDSDSTEEFGLSIIENRAMAL